MFFRLFLHGGVYPIIQWQTICFRQMYPMNFSLPGNPHKTDADFIAKVLLFRLSSRS